MKIPNKIKKFSTIVEVLHTNIDLNRFYVVIFKQAFNLCTFIEVKSYDQVRYPQVVMQIIWSPNNEYIIEIPDYICNAQLPAIQNINYGRPY